MLGATLPCPLPHFYLSWKACELREACRGCGGGTKHALAWSPELEPARPAALPPAPATVDLEHPGRGRRGRGTATFHRYAHRASPFPLLGVVPAVQGQAWEVQAATPGHGVGALVVGQRGPVLTEPILGMMLSRDSDSAVLGIVRSPLGAGLAGVETPPNTHLLVLDVCLPLSTPLPSLLLLLFFPLCFASGSHRPLLGLLLGLVVQALVLLVLRLRVA